MSSSSSNYSYPFAPVDTECKCHLPLKQHTSWTKENPCRRYLVCPNRYKPGIKKCKFWDWVDPELDNDWYRDHLFEMHRLLNPSQRQELQNAISNQEKLVLLQDEVNQLKTDLKKIEKKAYFWKSSVFVFVVLAWFVYLMN